MRPVVLDLGAVSFVDATGLEALSELLLRPAAGLHLVLADPCVPVLATLHRSGLMPKLGGHCPSIRADQILMQHLEPLIAPCDRAAVHAH